MSYSKPEDVILIDKEFELPVKERTDVKWHPQKGLTIKCYQYGITQIHLTVEETREMVFLLTQGAVPEQSL